MGKARVDETEVHLMMPLTFMNLSGKAVRSYLDYYHLSREDVIVICDDVSLPFGKIRFRLSGSPGGHNGLKSIEAYLGSPLYMRLRMGVGHPKEVGELPLADYVLSAFSFEEEKNLNEFIERGSKILLRVLNESPTKVMTEVNAREVIKNEVPNGRAGENKNDST